MLKKHLLLIVLGILGGIAAQGSSSPPSNSPTTTTATTVPSTRAPTGSPPPGSPIPTSSPGSPITTATTTTSKNTTRTTRSSYGNSSAPPDVQLSVPNLSVGRIELDVDNLQADINLNADVAQLVTVNAGVSASIKKVNLTISDVKVELDLVVRLGHLADIVNRVFESLDLNPLLITAINNVTSILDTVVGAVDGLLGSITQGGTVLSFLIDNLGNIVQELVTAAGQVTNTIVGNWRDNMTYTGKTQQLGNGLVQKQYSYSPLSALVNIVFNAAGQIVRAVVVRDTPPGQLPSGTSTATPSNSPTAKAGASG